jgi:3-dehydroquinate dehydratase/shikimate dehydrogenase
MVYNPLVTRLLQECQGKAKTISGVEMFVAQAARQYELWTGLPAPRELMRDVVLQRLTSPLR